MQIVIRRAKQSDSQALARIIKVAFDEASNLDKIQSHLPDQQVWVACHKDRVLGFVAGFVTTTQIGLSRIELDLLAVDPAVQGRAIGCRLVSHFMRHAQPLKVMMRALVTHDNAPMHHVLRRCGFVQQPLLCSLFVAMQGAQHAMIPDCSHLIVVRTLTYSGIWLEGAVTEHAIAAAHHLRVKHKADLIGAVIAQEDRAAYRIAEPAMTHINYYHWWYLRW